MRTLASVLAATTATVALAGAVLGATLQPAQAATTTVDPDRLARGVEVAGPHFASLSSSTIVDGDVRVRVAGDRPRLLGIFERTYVVSVVRDGVSLVVRIDRRGEERVAAEGDGVRSAQLGERTGLLVVPRLTSAERSRVEVIDVRSATTYTSRTWASPIRVLDVARARDFVIVGGDRIGTQAWDLTANTTRTITRRSGYAADVDAGRLATYDRDPYLGGCSIVTTIAAPSTRVWTSCDERVSAFSPDGRRLATVDILADGLGPDRVWARSVRGRLLASYSAPSYFGDLRFESDRALLLDTYGTERATTARCVDDSCVRATALSASPEI